MTEQEKRLHRCCFTGHRPQSLPFGYDEQDPQCIRMRFLIWNEADENMCYIRIDPTAGFFHKDGTGYKIDFTEKTVKTFPFTFDTVLTEES